MIINTMLIVRGSDFSEMIRGKHGIGLSNSKLARMIFLSLFPGQEIPGAGSSIYHNYQYYFLNYYKIAKDYRSVRTRLKYQTINENHTKQYDRSWHQTVSRLVAYADSQYKHQLYEAIPVTANGKVYFKLLNKHLYRYPGTNNEPDSRQNIGTIRNSFAKRDSTLRHNTLQVMNKEYNSMSDMLKERVEYRLSTDKAIVNRISSGRTDRGHNRAIISVSEDYLYRTVLKYGEELKHETFKDIKQISNISYITRSHSWLKSLVLKWFIRHTGQEDIQDKYKMFAISPFRNVMPVVKLKTVSQTLKDRVYISHFSNKRSRESDYIGQISTGIGLSGSRNGVDFTYRKRITGDHGRTDKSVNEQAKQSNVKSLDMGNSLPVDKIVRREIQQEEIVVITEKVYQMFEQRLQIERERRGLN